MVLIYLGWYLCQKILMCLHHCVFLHRLLLFLNILDIFSFTDPIKTNIPMAISVTFFFVLSGFILAYVYQDIEKSGKKFDFYVALIARAWTLHIATLLLAFFLLPLDKMLFHQPHYIITTLLNASLLHAWVPYSTVFFFL